MAVVDESTTIKNRNAQRTKNLMALNPYIKYRRIPDRLSDYKVTVGFI